MQWYCWHVERRERDAGNDLVPSVKAYLEETLKRSWGAEVPDEGDNVEDAFFEIDVAPFEASEP